MRLAFKCVQKNSSRTSLVCEGRCQVQREGNPQALKLHKMDEEREGHSFTNASRTALVQSHMETFLGESALSYHKTTWLRLPWDQGQVIFATVTSVQPSWAYSRCQMQLSRKNKCLYTAQIHPYTQHNLRLHYNVNYPNWSTNNNKIKLKLFF
jgi:hypothetical protein